MPTYTVADLLRVSEMAEDWPRFVWAVRQFAERNGPSPIPEKPELSDAAVAVNRLARLEQQCRDSALIVSTVADRTAAARADAGMPSAVPALKKVWELVRDFLAFLQNENVHAIGPNFAAVAREIS